MSNTENENITSKTDDDPGTSGFLNAGETSDNLDLGGLFSSKFTNIKQINGFHGGPAQLYTATRYGKRFVLKGLKEQYSNDPIYTLAMAKEFEIGMMLDHPNIRRTISLEEVEGLGKVIVLEYVDGCSLGELLEKETLTVGKARDIAAQVASALAYIHSKQIYHRDLKPSNILVVHNNDVVKLIDFNLSDSDEFIVLKNPAGSKKYMAPELMEEGAQPTALADIFSMGVVMSQLAAAAGDEQLDCVARKCMHSDPHKRPQSIARLKLPSPLPSLRQSVYNFLSSKTLTYFLTGICVILSAIILYFKFVN